MPSRHLISLLLLAVCAACTPSFADCEASGATRAIGIEEAWIENAVYFFGQGRPSLSPEADLAFSPRIGMEIDFPSVDPAKGVLSSTWGAGLKVPIVQDCGGDHSAYLTAELEGQYNARHEPAPVGLGNSITVQTEWAMAYPIGFFEGEAGHASAIGRGGLGGWFANASLGHHFGPVALQVEGEIDDEAPPGPWMPTRVEGSVFPQIALQAGPAWLMAAGEQRSFSPTAPRWTTWFMVEREFD